RFRGSIAWLLYSLFTLHAAITDDYAKLVSRVALVVNLCRVGFNLYPQGFFEEFLLLNIYVSICQCFPSSRAYPGATHPLTFFFSVSVRVAVPSVAPFSSFPGNVMIEHWNLFLF
ncbi:MAG: hypothetical protein NT166_05690, partial [Candidatus Aminicenantes bacterium]|nr:hypothetical protein [Candidatus Aminicenantes bacterium]